ncbi:histone H3-H4 chaperone Spt2 [Schizosaccharomyces pombe]|uniref:Protein spt2 n=1 Tax=Schizosaccharomyces pombe (strain 972 / ATCC 24843) TaxID=284812 RepID=SPT2_SCHPO|nr:putative non-specific DNA-binding protein Spt2 [Schizosaccharomyces pombe]O94714.1 RecName: Full=Protein spt2 [Schizosaccharomyces pombe 972h-]CAB38158.1 non-specific DNA binding protein Spt2 (predicted) [Schizosaccharomyces pombe]|eukprot:NP_587960.1 putative non-specific DNA-binding protein Spt2 [Schizosaccharomyces pombe]
MAGTPSFQKLMALADSQSAQAAVQIEQLRKAQIREKAREITEERNRQRKLQRERELRQKYEEEQRRQQAMEAKRIAASTRQTSERPPLSAEEAKRIREVKEKDRLESKKNERQGKPRSYNELLRQASSAPAVNETSSSGLLQSKDKRSQSPHSPKKPVKNSSSRDQPVRNSGATSTASLPPAGLRAGRGSQISASLAWLKTGGASAAPSNPRQPPPTSNFSNRKARYASNGLVQLQTGPKRDKRSAGEVQDEIMKRRQNSSISQAATPRTVSNSETSYVGSPALKQSKPNSLKSNNTSRKTSASSAITKPKARPHTSRHDEFVVSDDDELNDRVPDVSSEIWKIFGKRKQDYVSRDVFSDEDDMEATGHDVWREEQAAARAARLEDELEEQRERERELAKKRRKNK